MGGLFGGKRRSEPVATPAKPAPQPDSALADDPRPMPDPESPAARRAATEERNRVSRRSGRVSTDLTMRQRRQREQPRSALGSF
ncbi:hypothetical protein [Pelagibacterium luteolum]|uniref:Uncharacterized protein n=1 Tax=Pelagibacterium luteolum TaxID=440168 RepID=A0A1G7ZHV9_9HYPH|nr:hypothetical protein [Pelagibacterium luteolum]SDH08313.1 hypothetical protein SAMN04487974_12029 [Pelagibacterium luteolum]